jgi:precorrin-3B synthase
MSPIAPRRMVSSLSEAPRRKGWCPGALRPMETGDGLLARIRASGGRLTLRQATAVADAALACGNGVIELSSRANLQIRGVSERTLAALQAQLAAVDLIDADPEVERLRNIVASPLSDVDPAAALDLADSIVALENRLAEDMSLRPLPAKFSFVLEAGGRLPLAEVDADVRFEADRGADGAVFAAYVAGEDALAAICAPGQVGEAAARLAGAFLALAGTGENAARRMRALVRRNGAKAVFAAAGLEARPRPGSRAHASLHHVLGGHVFGSAIVVGFAAPFGIIEASRFKALIERARELGASGLRLTPWRAFLIVGLPEGPERAARAPPPTLWGRAGVGGRAALSDLAFLGGQLEKLGPTPLPNPPPQGGRESASSQPDAAPGARDARPPIGLDPGRAASIVAAGARLGFVAKASDPRLRVAVCPGAPACLHGLKPVRDDAERFATQLPKGEGIALHVSGCSKGCARPYPTAATLTATECGYDLVVNGKAGDAPARRGLSSAEAAAVLAAECDRLFTDTRATA